MLHIDNIRLGGDKFLRLSLFDFDTLEKMLFGIQNTMFN